MWDNDPMFRTPQIGDIVTVVTRQRDHYYKRTSDFKKTTYTNVEVQRPFDWLSNFEFCIAADGPETQFGDIEMVEKAENAPKFNPLAMRYESKYTPSNIAPKFTTRVIHMRSVVSINGVDVSNEDYSSKTVEVPGSKPSTSYKVQVEGGIGVSCQCKGFQFNKKCRHLQEAEDLV